jgi:threonine synthase
MNVGHPSNLARLIAIYGGQMDEQGNINKMPDMEKLRNDIYSSSVTDEETKSTMREILEKYSILIEPHGAVGIKGLTDYRNKTQDNTFAVTLETAHPAKFPGEVRKVTGIDPEPPRNLKEIEEKEAQMDFLDTEYIKFKEYLLAKIG